MGETQSLATALAEIASLPSASSVEDVPLERLVELPPTAELEAEQARRAARMQSFPEDSVPYAHAARDWAHAGYRAALGARRDAIQATRPEGCWCLGTGGKGARFFPAIRGATEPGQVWEQHCPCPDGHAAAARDEEVRTRYVNQKARVNVARLFAHAQVPPRLRDCTFDTYPVTATTAEAVARMRAWVDRFDPPHSVLLYGEYGRGKTGLAVAAMRARIDAEEVSALFITVPDLLDRIRATYTSDKQEREEAGTERALLEAVRAVEVLVLDDLGAERATGWVQEKLFAIINARYDQQRDTIFTSNLDPAGLAAHLGERTAWRIVEMCEVIRLDGPNLRERKRT